MSSIKPSQLKITNDQLVIGETKNGVNNVGVGLSAHADSDLTFSVDSSGNKGIKFLLKAASVTATEIATGAVGSAEIATNAVGSDEIAENAVGSSEIDLTADYTFTGAFIVPAPTADTHAATKLYVDSKAQGLDFKDSCVVATTANIAGGYSSNVFTVTANGAPTVDGVTLVSGERILFKDQTDATQNGVYTVTTVGDGSSQTVYTRATDFDTNAEITAGAYVLVTEGTDNTLNAYVLNKEAVSGGDPDLDADDLDFTLFSGTSSNYSGGNGIAVTGTSIAVDLLTSGGLEIDSSKVAINLEASNPTIQIDGSNQLGIKIGTTGGEASLVTSATGLQARVDDETVKIGSNGLKAAVLARHAVESPTSAVTGTNPALTTVDLASTPANGTDVLVFVNGVMLTVGNGTIANVDCFFLASGVTNTASVRAFDDLVSGDVLWFNPGNAGFDLDTTDDVKIMFSAVA
jgi:hypothetical protein